MNDGQQNVHKHSQHSVLFLLVAGLRPLCNNDHAMRKIQIGKCWETRTKRESPSDIMHPQRNARLTCTATDHIHVLHVQWHSLIVSGCFHHVLWILEEAVTLLSSQRRRKQGELMEVMTAQNSLHTNAHENWLHDNMKRLKDHAASCFSPPDGKRNHQLTWIIMIFTDPRQTGVMIGAQQYPS